MLYQMLIVNLPGLQMHKNCSFFDPFLFGKGSNQSSIFLGKNQSNFKYHDSFK